MKRNSSFGSESGIPFANDNAGTIRIRSNSHIVLQVCLHRYYIWTKSSYNDNDNDNNNDNDPLDRAERDLRQTLRPPAPPLRLDTREKGEVEENNIRNFEKERKTTFT